MKFNLVQRWRDFEKTLKDGGFDFALSYAPRKLRQLRTIEAPHGGTVEHLLPEDYKEFVAEVGYPMLGFCYYDRYGFSFLPPESMTALSVNVPTHEDLWPEYSSTEPVLCFVAFFAGYELSDYEGFGFALDEDNEELVVWSIEGGMPRETLGTFSHWLRREIERVEAQLPGMDAEALRAEYDGEGDPHRLLDYSLYDGNNEPFSDEDLQLHWVHRYEGRDSLFGLLNDDGKWLIDYSNRFLRVRSFRNGVAEVILRGEGATYSGPWTKIRTDGSLVT